jgi:hypothetical protein
MKGALAMKRPPIESGMSQDEEMTAIGLNPKSKMDRKYFKILYTIWEEEKVKLVAAGVDQSNPNFNSMINDKVTMRMAELMHGTIN